MIAASLAARIAVVNDLLCAANVLTWDSRTMMPPGAVAARGRQLATLTVLARRELLSAETRHAVDAALRATEAGPPDSAAHRAAEQTRDAIAHHDRVPEALEARRAESRTVAQAAWAAARAASDFAAFAPYLAEQVALVRELAEAIGYAVHPYDALIGLYEPGETVASLDALFATLRAGLLPLVRAATGRPPPRLDVLSRDYPPEAQRAFGLMVAERFGYDLARGRLDPTVHPFEISATRDDVRITTRYDRHNIVSALQGIMHEAGHGLYEQSVDPAYSRTTLTTDLIGLYAVGGTSFGAHESQSRLWENHVGRSRRFWALQYPELRAVFPDALADIDADTFYAAFNAVRPGLIRVEADELTYDLHVMLRVDLERRLVEGSLAVAELPEAWNAAMAADLGVAVPDDRRGVLQDVHWASGYVGSFCTYTVGNVMAAQLHAAAARDPAVAAGQEAGDYAPLRGWLTDAVCRHGRRFGRDELLVRATGRGLEAADYVGYLAGKYSAT